MGRTQTGKNLAEFEPLRSGKYAAEVAGQIKKTIFRGTYGPGDKLPSEGELAKSFEVSTVSIRQAIRVLESAGLVYTKRGAEGGVFVAEANTMAVSTYLSDMLHLKRVTLGDLTMARLIFEPEIARRVAEKWKDEELTELEENIGMVEHALGAGELKEARTHNLCFHRIMSSLTKNPVVIFTMNSVMDVLTENVRETDLEDHFVRDELAAHKVILEYIRARDGDTACDQMRVHIRIVHDRLGEFQRTKSLEKAGR